MPRDGKTQRAIRFFAAVALAGELATRFEITGWQRGAALAAASDVVRLWKTETGALDEAGFKLAVERIATFISDSQNAFSPLGGSMAAGPDAKAGWIDTDRIYIRSKAWDAIHRSFDPHRAAQAMHRHGVLTSNNGTGFTFRMPKSVPNRPHVYAIDREKFLRSLGQLRR